MITHLKKKQTVFDINTLPENAVTELMLFYEFLIHKYGKQESAMRTRNIPEAIEKLSWDMGGKLFRNRDELYER
jgi:hypothetical protein